ncbi:ATP-dependent DNA helicase UvrD/PcrA, partial [hydrothermal vent metagenome]
MDVSKILDPLNSAQRAAVCHASRHALVLAGAGSGKTRVLVHRIAWLIDAENVSPFSVLAVTFTNKAAAEMRGRIETLLGIPASGMWVGTFHGIAHRLLRAHWQEAELPQNFQILDSDDQLRTLKRLIREMGLDDSQWPAKEAQWYINARKDEGVRAGQVVLHRGQKDDLHLLQMIEIYKQYEALCQRSGMIDFAEMLLRAKELWQKRPDVLQHYRERFQNILVDEFQDTNSIQYAWIKLLAGETGRVFAVGDDDQSIYGWRGAKIENIHQYSRDFKSAEMYRLEQNYRSTANILNAANGLIANNTDRLGKELWTEDADGELIQVYSAFNEIDEANYIVDNIQQRINEGYKRSECAILYRSNAQSRVLEESLIMVGMPYRVYGGLRFFDRQEIRDVLAYLRIMTNRNDAPAFERIINTPTRGIGNKTLEAVRATANEQNLTLWQAVLSVIESKLLTARAISALQIFIDLINEHAEVIQNLSLSEKIEHVVHHSGLEAHYEKEKGERGRARIENMQELVQAGVNFEAEDWQTEDENMDELSAFLSHAALEAGEGQADEWDDCVQLMTLHSAKGLEFKQVYICGVEEGLFPHRLSAEDPVRLEEERRLCYVGMTRAMENLSLSYAEKRRIYGQDSYPTPSRFLKEIPQACLHQIRTTGFAQQAVSKTTSRYTEKPQTDNGMNISLGQRVLHPSFGEGMVMNYEGEGRHARVQINFEEVGSKWLVMEYANLSL